ncbi:hypothetical protein CEXT_338601 [Caerostris extrusa]|uniref:Uncharacterized protein n=1 Tax=Caerostris extrusa TaxID=172846 RepID=A0AAV4Q9B2_CAEEX|nr:hypothetical protein CEXT_338601 [Caerostris extrusa]
MEDTCGHFKNKAVRIHSVLKGLTDQRGSCDRETLKTSNKLYIQPINIYCSDILINTHYSSLHYCYSPHHPHPENVIQILEVIQNQALCIITRAVRSTSVLAMQLLA